MNIIKIIYLGQGHDKCISIRAAKSNMLIGIYKTDRKLNPESLTHTHKHTHTFNKRMLEII